MKELNKPLNAEERYMYGINMRLNILIEMFSSFLDVYAKEEEIVTTNNEEIFVDEVEEVEEIIERSDFDYNTLTKSEIIKDLEIHGVYHTKSMLKEELVKLAQEYL